MQSKEVNACWSTLGQNVQKFGLLKVRHLEISLSRNFGRVERERPINPYPVNEERERGVNMNVSK